MSRGVTLASVLAMAMALTLASCGYSLRPQPALKAVRIGDIDNRSHEPGLGDELRMALTMELASRGVRVSGSAGREISGTLSGIEISPLAVRSGVVVKFSVRIGGTFTLSGPDGKATELQTPLSYIVTFGSDVPLDDLYAMRQEAVRRAINNLAEDMAVAAAYGR